MTHKQGPLDVSALYADLAKACRSAAYPKVILIAEKILKSSSADSYAIKCKVVALIHQERFEDCLDFIRRNKISGCDLEKAYCEYRLNRLVDALKTVNSCQSESDGIMELKAQILYRFEEFDKAVSCYEKLTGFKDDYGDERSANLLAAKAAASCYTGKTSSIEYSPGMFETEFNAACYYIGQQDYATAMKYLNKAEKMCIEMFENDSEATEDIINQEVAPIRIQKGYVLQQQKKEDAASEIYHTVLRQRSGDPSLIAVAANNLTCINKEQNVFDSRKRIKASSIDGLQHKLFLPQRTSILVNQGLFYLHINQLEACRVKAKAVLDENENCVRGILLTAAHLTRSRQIGAAMKTLENFTHSTAFEEIPDHQRLQVSLMLVQLRVLSASGAMGVEPTPAPLLRSTKALGDEIVSKIVSEDLGEHRLSHSLARLPMVASLRVALLLASSGNSTAAHGGDATDDEEVLAAAKTVVSDTLDYWSTNSSKVVDGDRLLTRCIDFFRTHGFAQEAASLLEQRLAALKNSPPTEETKKQQQSLFALLIQAYSKFDPEKAHQASRDLEFKEKLSEKEISSLETTFLFGVKSVKKLARSGATAPTPKSGGKPAEKSSAGITKTPKLATTPGQAKKTQKRRKLQLPKNYEPGVPPDPERWLPRRERAGYRGRRRDKKQANLTRGPQGATSTAAPELDMGSRPAPVSSTPPGSGSAAASNQAPQQRRPQAKGHKSGKKVKRR